MEEKFKEFLNFDWKTSKEWEQYFNINCYIAPPITGDKILKARKKFYKLKIDADFDINFNPETTPDHKHEYANKNNNENRRPLLDQLIAAIEGFLWVAFFMNVLLPQYVLNICLMAVIMRFLRLYWPCFLSKGFYRHEIIRNDLIHLMIYCLILMTDKINYLNLFPFTSTAVYCICEYFYTYLRIFQFLKKYFLKVVNYKRKIEECRAFSFILFGVYLLFAVWIRWSSLKIGFVYLIFLVFLYYFNDDFRVSFFKVKRYVTSKFNKTFPPPN